MTTSPIGANFRDVGVTVNTLSDRSILKEGVLYRGGAIRDVDDPSRPLRPPRSLCTRHVGISTIAGWRCTRYDVAETNK